MQPIITDYTREHLARNVDMIYVLLVEAYEREDLCHRFDKSLEEIQDLIRVLRYAKDRLQLRNINLEL